MGIFIFAQYVAVLTCFPSSEIIPQKSGDVGQPTVNAVPLQAFSDK